MTVDKPPRRMSMALKHALEFGPLVIFFVVMLTTNIYTATAVLMGVAVLVSLTAYIIEGRIPTLILFGSVLALVFGSLTLFFHDETFIKVRPTITFSLLGSVLLGGLAFGRIFLRSLFEYAFQIDEAGWRKLTTRIAVWFFVLAIANHLVWTNFSAEFWAGYKLFAVPAMMLAFMALQAPLLLRHQLPGANAENQGSEQAPD